jgi:hypothetical protein
VKQILLHALLDTKTACLQKRRSRATTLSEVKRTVQLSADVPAQTLSIAEVPPVSTQDGGIVNGKTEGKTLLESLSISQLKLLLQLMQMLFQERHGDTSWQELLAAADKCGLLSLLCCYLFILLDVDVGVDN